MTMPCVCMLASKRNATLYAGVTSDLVQRVRQHRCELAEGFTKGYGVHRLVWYEVHQTMESAILRERAPKKWNRAWKIRLIQETDPAWKDLYDEIA